MEREIPVEVDDYYGLLEVDPAASDEVVVAAYDALRSKTDGLENARREAFDVLSDSARRQNYDEALINNYYGPGNIGNYQILRIIMQNGFGKTYAAKHLETGMLVWITHANKISPRTARILREEVIKSWDLQHPSIPVIRDFFKMPDGRYVVVTSSVVGKTLEQLVLENGKLEPIHIGWIIDRSLNAYRYLHHYGRVHGGGNPKSIILQHDHAVVLIRSNFVGVNPELICASSDYDQIFMPPEQISNEKLWPESDFFSLGASMIYALTGDIEAVKDVQFPDFVPRPLREFIRLLMKKDSQYRPRWEDENLIQTFRQVRIESFGKDHTDMEPIPGLSEDTSM